MGAERKSQYLDPKNKLATAYHEVFIGLIQTPFLNQLIVPFPREATRLSLSIQTELCPFTRSLAFPVATLWVMYAENPVFMP